MRFVSKYRSSHPEELHKNHTAENVRKLLGEHPQVQVLLILMNMKAEIYPQAQSK